MLSPPQRTSLSCGAAPRKTDKELIPLSLGDPTIYGNLLPPEFLTEAVVKAVRGRKCNGYAHSAGTPGCRAAVTLPIAHRACYGPHMCVFFCRGRVLVRCS